MNHKLLQSDAFVTEGFVPRMVQSQIEQGKRESNSSVPARTLDHKGTSDQRSVFCETRILLLHSPRQLKQYSPAAFLLQQKDELTEYQAKYKIKIRENEGDEEEGEEAAGSPQPQRVEAGRQGVLVNGQ